MIDLSQGQILSLIIASLLSGIFLGMSYESVRICKAIICPSSQAKELISEKIRVMADVAFTFVTDFTFCVLAASAALLLTYNISGGIFRGCVYLCMVVGWLLYRVTMGRLTKKLDIDLAKAIKKLIKMTARLLVIPIRIIFSFVARIYTLTIGKKVCKIISRIQKRREERKKGRVKTGEETESLPKEEEENAYREGYIYKRECRKSFCGRR